MARPGPGAAARAVEQELTDHQRRIFIALVVDAVPLDALADRLGTSRNAIYKTMYDARGKLRASLVANGYLPDAARRWNCCTSTPSWPPPIRPRQSAGTRR